MYEALILDLKERLKRFPPDEFNPDFYRIKGAFEALEAMNDLFADIQVENGSKDREIERLRKELTKAHAMDTLTDYNQDFLRTEIKRVEAERDALLEYANAQMECETCKHDVFCPLANPMQENCALCELKPKCPCHPCKWEWRGAQEEG